ncbi:MAG: PTS sugar transporter subunit IIA, partial [Rhodoglobus sp.]
EEYLIDLDDDDFIMRLSLHVRNLIVRAQDLSYSRNPMTRSIKTTYPMIYELAVFIAAEVQREEGIVIHDDEISYIALHVGSHLERQAKREVRLTAALVCPNYHDLHVILRERIEAVLGDELQLRIVITRTDVDLAELSTDLVLTTIDLRSFADNVILIQPFLTETDVDAIRRAIGRVRRLRRRRQLTDELLRFFDPALFLRNFTAPSEEAMIAALGHRMIEAGVIDHSYITGAIERERMSSTAFTDTLAVPHAMTMNAHRTAISIVINETPMPWGENRVNVIALIAFSAAGRTTFQTVFDQFVTVFSDRDYVQQLVKKAVDFPTFIDELVRGIED